MRNWINIRLLGLFLISISFLILPTFAYANAGTPLIWIGLLHLVIGNFIIGIAEGKIIASIFKLTQKRAIPIMILANYASMIIGALLMAFAGKFLLQYILDGNPLYNAPKALIIMVAISYLATIVLEWPFCLWALKDTIQRNKRSLYASVIAQTASYAVIIPLYLFVSPISMYTEVDIDPSLSFANNQASVYYISLETGDLYATRVNGTGIQKVLKVGITENNARLFFRLADDNKHRSLWVKGYPNEEATTLLVKNFTIQTSAIEDESNGVRNNWFNFAVHDLRPEDQRYWSVRTGFWEAEGLQARNDKTGEALNVSIETPFIAWHVRAATVLPGNQVVLQLGEQIVLLDLNKRKIGLIAMGRSPVVVLDN